MVGMRWKAWKTMPMASRRKRARPSSSRVPRSMPATATRPRLGRSRPPVTIISVDLPEPEGPTRLTVSPGATRSETPRRTLTGPAALASVRCTSASSIMGMSEPGEACMSFFPKPGCLFARRRALGRYGDAAPVFNMTAPVAILFLLLAAFPAAAQAGTRVLAFGDSLTAGFGLMPDQAFPVRLQARLAASGTAVEMTNAGVSGDTSAGGLARLDWALAEHPDVVLVELGANDALRGIDPKQTYANLDKILARIKASGAKVLLLGMLAPPNWGRDYEKEFDAIYPE